MSAPEVYDGWNRWRCRIETRTTKRGKQQWRYVIERHFTRWQDDNRGRWTGDYDNAVRSGHQALEARNPYRYDSSPLPALSAASDVREKT